MRKDKKITIKFFLNKLLEAATGDKGEKYYPLYIQVTYNRKNMQLKSKYGEYYESIKEVKKDLMEFEERMLTKVIRYESSHTSTEYDLKGLKHKYEIYSGSVSEALERYLKPKLRLAILRTNKELTHVFDFKESRATTALLNVAAQKLFPDFDKYVNAKLQEDLESYGYYNRMYPECFFTYNFPTVIEWVEGSYKKDLESKLRAVYKNKPEIIKKVMSLIEQAIVENLKQLSQ